MTKLYSLHFYFLFLATLINLAAIAADNEDVPWATAGCQLSAYSKSYAFMSMKIEQVFDIFGTDLALGLLHSPLTCEEVFDIRDKLKELQELFSAERTDVVVEMGEKCELLFSVVWQAAQSGNPFENALIRVTKGHRPGKKDSVFEPQLRIGHRD